MVTDNGYATRENVEKMAAGGVEFIAPWKEDQSREAGACKANGIEMEFAGSRFALHADGDGLICKAGRKLVQIAERSRNLKGHGLEEGASTRMLIHAGKLVGNGIPLAEACRIALILPITDDPDMRDALEAAIGACI